VCILIHTFLTKEWKKILSYKSITTSVLWDRLGIGVSGICAIHCLAFPVLISVLPLLSIAPILHQWAHPVFIVLLVPIVYFAAKRSHYDLKITTLLLSGLVLVVTGWLAGHYWLGIVFETVVTVLGSAVLIAGHWLNYRHHRVCKNSSHNHHPGLENLEDY